MTVSVVLRLVERALASGRLAGEAENVKTGERRTILDAEELVEFLRRPMPNGGDPPPPPRSANGEGGEP